MTNMSRKWIVYSLCLGISVLLAACQSEKMVAEATPTMAVFPTDTPVAISTLEPTAISEAEETAVPPTATVEATATLEPLLFTYTIQPDESEALFRIDETLFGNPKTVVGRTNDVNGEISLDWNHPVQTEISPIQINARDLTTDDSFRNRALRSQILDSGEDVYQFIIFTPTDLRGLPTEPIVAGETYNFELLGDLVIREITQSVTFAMMVTAVSESELSGSGEATVLRSNYELNIPEVPGVANVADEVLLEITFVATTSN